MNEQLTDLPTVRGQRLPGRASVAGGVRPSPRPTWFR